MESAVLAALAEPNRLRIVELLAAAPRPVGEIAAALALRQPQVSKHLQVLERAGLVEVHPLGRRRVCALRRGAFEEVGRWAAGLAVPGPDDVALSRYRTALASPELSAVTVRRVVGAGPAAVWQAFTDAGLAGRWWHPRHFAVAGFGFEARRGGAVELVLREGDGAEHRARGSVLEVDRPRRLVFTLDPLDPAGAALLTVRHEVALSRADGGTEVEVVVTPSDVRAGAEPAVAGLGIGWEQLLANLAELAADGGLG